MEEFSFPSVAAELDTPTPLSFPRFASPLLWAPSAASCRNQRRRSFSTMDDLKQRDAKFSTEVGDEERMDMLWQDFNDEPPEVPCEGNGGGKWGGAGDGFCTRAVPHQRPGLMVMFKVLKTLLLFQKIRKRRNLSTTCHM